MHENTELNTNKSSAEDISHNISDAHQNYDKKYFKTTAESVNKLVTDRSQFQLTHQFYLKHLKRYHRTGRLLDFGCGLGHFLKQAQDHYETYGIDISEYCISEASQIADKSKTYVGGSEKLDSFKNGYFDIITAIDVLEHIPEPREVITKFYSKLNKNGVVLINTPNTASLGRKLKKDKWFAYQDQTHSSIYPRKSWIRLFEEQGFSVKEVIYDGLWDSPYLPFLPSSFQHMIFKIPSIILVNWVRFPEKLGENICIIAEK